MSYWFFLTPLRQTPPTPGDKKQTECFPSNSSARLIVYYILYMSLFCLSIVFLNVYIYVHIIFMCIYIYVYIYNNICIWCMLFVRQNAMLVSLRPFYWSEMQKLSKQSTAPCSFLSAKKSEKLSGVNSGCFSHSIGLRLKNDRFCCNYLCNPKLNDCIDHYLRRDPPL